MSLKPRLLILGVGGHGRSVAEAVAAAGMFEVAGFLDDAAPALLQLGCHMVLGNRLISAGFELATVVHPRAMVSPSAVIGPGSAVMAGAIVGTETRLGCGVIINCSAVVDHDAQVHDYGHLGVNACMSGGSESRRGRRSHRGTGILWEARPRADGSWVSIAARAPLPQERRSLVDKIQLQARQGEALADMKE